METISVTLFIPGTNLNIRHDRVESVDHQASDGLAFTLKNGTRIVTTMPYIIAYEKELLN